MPARLVPCALKGNTSRDTTPGRTESSPGLELADSHKQTIVKLADSHIQSNLLITLEPTGDEPPVERHITGVAESYTGSIRGV